MAMHKFTVAFCVAVCPALAVAQGAIQYQRGDDNQAELQQLGGIGNISQQYQDGTGNRNQVNVVQIYYDAELTISQIGDDNSIQTEQYDLHTKAAAINQIGDFNHAVLGQTAGFTSNQVATITQQGNGNRATALQQ